MDMTTPSADATSTVNAPLRAKTIAVCEIGHGHVKALGGLAASSPSSKVVFPSLVQPISAAEPAPVRRRADSDVVTVRFGDNWYQVGREIELVAAPKLERNRDSDYCRTDEYAALIIGALSYLDVEEVDMLMLGLPLTTYEANYKALERFRGMLSIPSITGRAALRQVPIRRVIVMPQPSAALFCAQSQIPELKTARVLTLDCGFHTLDALVSINMRPQKRRSVAIEGGMSRYIEAIQESVASEIRLKRPSMPRDFRVSPLLYEKALMTGQSHVSLAPGKIAIAEHLSTAHATMVQNLRSVLASIGDANDIEHIVLAGGGAQAMLRAVEEVFPIIGNVHLLEDSQMAVAKGMWMFGCNWTELSDA